MQPDHVKMITMKLNLEPDGSPTPPVKILSILLDLSRNSATAQVQLTEVGATLSVSVVIQSHDQSIGEIIRDVYTQIETHLESAKEAIRHEG